MEKSFLSYPDAGVFTLEITVGDNREIIDMRKAMVINEKNLQEECAKQPGWFAWYSALLADQEGKAASKKGEMESRAAELALQLHQGKLKLPDAKGEAIKITVAAVDSYVTGDKMYKVLKEELFAIEDICKKLRVLVSASIQRKDMLIQLGLLARQEMKSMGGPMGQV